MSGGPTWISAAPLLPHQPPARLVERIAQVADEEIEFEGGVPRDSPFREGGVVPGWVALELAAQAAAAWETGGMAGEPRREPRVGYIVAVRELVLKRSEFPADARLRGTIRLAGSAPPLTIYDVEVSCREGELLTGSLSTWVTRPTAS